MALVDGQMVAWMKRTLVKDRVDFALTPLRELTGDEVEALRRAAGRYGEFLALPVRLIGVPLSGEGADPLRPPGGSAAGRRSGP